MDFYEAEGAKLLAGAGIPVAKGILYRDEASLDQAPMPCVVKAQVLSGKRGKAGGIRFAETKQELKDAINAISSMRISGKPVEGIYLTEKLSIAKEHYLGFTIDTVAKSILLLYSPCGGMDIEAVAAQTPDQMLKLYCSEKFDKPLFVKELEKFSLSSGQIEKIGDIAQKLFELFCKLDATTLEINPLAELTDGSFVAADAKLVIDDNALYRQGNYCLLPRSDEREGAYRAAAEAGLAYVELEANGNIGIIAGGAGIGMATVDAVKHYGGAPFNFMDLGGGVTEEKMAAAVRLLIENPRVEALLINIFGGINNCHVMAKGIYSVLKNSPCRKTVVVKSRGFSQEEGWKLYDELGLPQVRYGTTDDAVKLLLQEMKEGKA